MRMLLRGAAIALALFGTTLATTSVASADSFSISTSNHGRDRHHARTAVSFSFGDVAFGYRDGYWDNNRRWHKWRNRGDHDNYRDQHRDNYRGGNHNRYRSHGWRNR